MKNKQIIGNFMEGGWLAASLLLLLAEPAEEYRDVCPLLVYYGLSLLNFIICATVLSTKHGKNRVFNK